MTKFLDTLLSSKAFKAWTGAAVALGGTLSQAAADGVVTGTEAGIAIGAALAALGLVYRVPNKSAE